MSEQQWGINTVLKQTQTPWLNPTISSGSAIFGQRTTPPTHQHTQEPPKPPAQTLVAAATGLPAPYLEDKGLTRADSRGRISRNVPVSNVPPTHKFLIHQKKRERRQQGVPIKEEVEARGVQRARELEEHPGPPN